MVGLTGMRVPEADTAWDLAEPSGAVHSRVAVTGVLVGEA